VNSNVSAWTFGGSILSFAFPMLLFIVVASALYVLYTKPEFVPGHSAPGLERPVSYTPVPGKPAAAAAAPATTPAQPVQTSAAEPAQTTTGEPTQTTTGEPTQTTTGEAAQAEGAE
jgi:hypothetical protein